MKLEILANIGLTIVPRQKANKKPRLELVR